VLPISTRKPGELLETERNVPTPGKGPAVEKGDAGIQKFFAGIALWRCDCLWKTDVCWQLEGILNIDDEAAVNRAAAWSLRRGEALSVE
jgi:hypothetical protein